MFVSYDIQDIVSVSKRLPVEDSHIKGTSDFIVSVNFGVKSGSSTYVAPRSVSLKRFMVGASAVPFGVLSR